MKKPIFIFIPVMFLGVCFHAFSEQDYNSPEMIKSFAGWLYEQEEFSRAAGEYYRYYYIAPEAEKDIVFSKIGLCQEKAEDYESAKNTYEQFLNKYPHSGLFEDVYYRFSYCLFKLKEHDSAVIQLERGFSAHTEHTARLLLLLGMNQLALEQWDSAHTSFSGYLALPNAPRQEMAEKLAQFAIDAKNISEKNPVLAGFLSVLFPGLGKFYAERPQDAIASIILVGVFSGLATYSFISDGSVMSLSGWVYAGLAGIFYLGDIWGSVVAASDYNDHKKRILKESVDETISDFQP